MENLKIELNKVYKPSTARTYFNSLKLIFKKMEVEISDDKMEKWFDIKKFYEVIKDLKQTSQRNYISSVISLMKMRKETGSDLFLDLSEKRDYLNSSYEDRIKKGEKTENESGNWATVDALKSLFEGEVVKFLDQFNLTKEKAKKPKLTDLTADQKLKIQKYVVIAFYLYPFQNIEKDLRGILRNDLPTIVLSKGKTPPKEVDQNFIWSKGTTLSIILNDHKTDKTKGQQVIKLLGLVNIIFRNYISMFEIKAGEKLFDFSKHDITNILIQFTKRHLKKNIGTQMLRKIYVTNKFGKLLEESKIVADNMLHSTATQQNVYIKDG